MDKFYKIVGAIVVGLVAILLSAFITGFFVMLFWNWLMPVLFGVVKITYIQGWGISALCGTLFKGTVKTEVKK